MNLIFIHLSMIEKQFFFCLKHIKSAKVSAPTFMKDRKSVCPCMHVYVCGEREINKKSLKLYIHMDQSKTAI